MDSKDLKIIPPEGMEAYQEGNEIKFRPIQKKITYRDIAKKLFKHNIIYYLDDFGNVKKLEKGEGDLNYSELNNCTSQKQVKKLLAINQLMNVAKYLNGDWQPNWNNVEENKYYIKIDVGSKIHIGCAYTIYSDIVYFKSMKLAEQAIEILEEETIRLALSTDW